ncbi:diaminopimelate decarboxylase, partial [Streptomyces sp. SID2955]|nr:diaminopimelate decarboxylase [Streptomyces sp. SID2955]
MTTVHEHTATIRFTDLSVWAASTTESAHGDLTVGGVPLAELADRFGTPVYVLDEAEV